MSPVIENPRDDLSVKLLPDVLKDLWQAVEEEKLTVEQGHHEQQRQLDEYKRAWKNTLVLKGHHDLKQSLLWELGSYFGMKDLAKVERQCRRSTATAKHEWNRKVQPRSRQAVEQYYEESRGTLYELMWWHTLCDDKAPLGYVTALNFARQRRCQTYLDFGAGVCSAGILFARNGFKVSLADISSSLLRFGQWRFELRRMKAQFIDLKSSSLPEGVFDFVTTMDVFEHLFDPVGAIEQLWESLKPGGFLFGRIVAQEKASPKNPQHIVRDIRPTFKRMQELGFVQVWQDEWLWGHKVFQKSLRS